MRRPWSRQVNHGNQTVPTLVFARRHGADQPVARPDRRSARCDRRRSHLMPTLDRTAASVLDLVDAYEPGRSAVFAAPDRTILAVGNQLGIRSGDRPGVTLWLAPLPCSSAPDVEILLAAIPFDPDRPAALVLPESVEVRRWTPRSARVGARSRRAEPGRRTDSGGGLGPAALPRDLRRERRRVVAAHRAR